MRILAVDDDDVFLDLLNATLGALEHEDVTLARSAKEALALMNEAREPFECFLLDIRMPGTDGIELCRMIRARPEYHAAPILMITAASEKQLVDKAFVNGATDYINKPIEAGEIMARLRTVEGMVQKSREIRQLSETVQSINGPQASIAFSDCPLLEDVDGLVTHMSFENYLFKLGKTGMFAKSLIGFHVSNARQIFDTAAPQDFSDLMSDVADAIWYAIRPSRILFTYTGSGDFAAVVSKVPVLDPEVVQEEVAAHLEPVMQWWASFGINAPHVVVGAPINHSLLSFSSPSASIANAIGDARKKAAVTYAAPGLAIAG